MKRAPTGMVPPSHGFTFRKSQKSAQYVRIKSSDGLSSARLATDLLSNTWKLDRPSIIITATGGAQDFPVENAIKESFGRGLIQAVKSSRAWVISGGTSAGVMDLIGKAFNDYLPSDLADKCPLLGVCTWGIIANKEQFGDEADGIEYNQISPNSGIQAGLQVHHSHFIFVDNGTEGIWGGEIEFRSNLEQYYSKDQSVPIVQIVLSGGPGTYKTVKGAVDLGFPVVVVKGTGNAADKICQYVEFRNKLRSLHRNITALAQDSSSSSDNRLNIHALQDEMKAVEEKVDELLTNDKGKDKELECILDSIWKGNLIFFDKNLKGGDTSQYTSDFNKALLMAVLADTKRSTTLDKLKLCVEFNRADVASDLIKTSGLPASDVTSALQYTLELIAQRDEREGDDMSAIVNLLLEQGAGVSGPLGIDFGRLFAPPKSMELLRHIETHIANVNRDFAREKQRKKSAALAVLHWWRQHRDQQSGAIIPALKAAMRFRSVLSQIRNEEPAASSYQMPIAEAKEKIAQWIQLEDTTRAAVAEYNNQVKTLFSSTAREIKQSHWVDATNPLVDRLAEALRKQQNLDVYATQEEIKRQLSRDSFASEKQLFARNITDLILWSLVTGRPTSLCFVFLRYCNHPIHAALAASYYLEQAERNEEAQKFQRFAVEILDDCVKERKKLGEKVLRQLSSHWGGRSCIELAQIFERREFVSHDLYQTLLDNQWHSVPSSRETNLSVSRSVSVFQIVLFLLSLGLFCRKSVKDKMTMSQVGSVPKVKFIGATLLHILYLLVYTQVTLDGISVVPDWIEILLLIWTLTLVYREVTQALDNYQQDGNIAAYLHSFWNQIDMLYLSIILIFFAARTAVYVRCNFREGGCVEGHPDDVDVMTVMHKTLAVNAIFAFLRLLDRFSLNSTLGPILIMIRMMINDVLALFSIMLIFLVGFGVTFTVLLRNELSTMSFSTLLARNGYFMSTFWALVGDNSLVEPIRSGDSLIGPTLLWIFLILVNVMLLNLLIAKMGHTYDKVAEDADVEWKFGRVEVIEEYSAEFFPPPLNILDVFAAVTRKKTDNEKKSSKREYVESAELRLVCEKVLLEWESATIDVKDRIDSLEKRIADHAERQTMEISELKSLMFKLQHIMGRYGEASHSVGGSVGAAQHPQDRRVSAVSTVATHVPAVLPAPVATTATTTTAATTTAAASASSRTTTVPPVVSKTTIPTTKSKLVSTPPAVGGSNAAASSSTAIDHDVTFSLPEPTSTTTDAAAAKRKSRRSEVSGGDLESQPTMMTRRRAAQKDTDNQ